MDPAWLFRKCIGGPFFFGNKVQTLRFHSLMEGNATRVVVEQWLNPLHSPWAQMKPSTEKFKLKMLFNTNLTPNLPTIYIYCKRIIYVCISLYLYALHVLYKASSDSHPIPPWRLWTHCKVHFYKRHLFSSHCTLGCLKNVV